MSVATRSAILAGLGLCVFAVLAIAKPECREDTFSGEKSCVYGRGTIGMPGIGNQIITKGGKMYFRRGIMLIGGNPVNLDAILFRVDDRRSIQIAARNVDRPSVSCSGSLCTWSWTVMAPIDRNVLSELAAAKKLIIAFRGEGRRIEESELKRGGQIFAKFLNDIHTNEPGVLESADTEAFLMEDGSLIPYTPLSETVSE